MAEIAKQQYISASNEDSRLNFEALELGLDLGSKGVVLSETALDSLKVIKRLDRSVFEEFKYAYNGTFRANN